MASTGPRRVGESMIAVSTIGACALPASVFAPAHDGNARASSSSLAVTAALLAHASEGTAATAPGRTVAVIVVPPFDPAAYVGRGAVGLVVPGTGSTVTRERALASLVRGRVVSSLVELDGDVRLRLADSPAETTIYIALPPPGRHRNVVRYPVAIVGSGYDGVLTSGSTRIDGLVSLADIAPTAEAIAAGTSPRIRSRADADPAQALARLDERLSRAHDARPGANAAVVGWLLAFASLGILGRVAVAGRAAVLVAPVALGAALVLRGSGIDDPATVGVALAVLTGAGSLALALRQVVARARSGRLSGGLPRHAGRQARVQLPGRDRAASGQPGPVLRDHESRRDAPARPGARGRDGGGRRRGGAHRAPAARRDRLEPGRSGRGRADRRRRVVRGSARAARSARASP